jgi:hypothetical protein
MIFEMDKPSESLAEFGSTLCVTFFFLLADYILRAKTFRMSFQKLVLESDPDCRILSFGALGAVFLDPGFDLCFAYDPDLRFLYRRFL